MPSKSSKRKRVLRASRRVGRVTIYQRGRTWYLYYLEDGQRIRRRVSESLDEARKLAAQVNAQLAAGARAMMSFTPVAIETLRRHWLDHHEHVLRSSLATIRRYRSATDHLLRFVERTGRATAADRLTVSDVERFVRFLRSVEVAPNGHDHSKKRHLRDRGIVFILEACRTLFNHAARHRHLPPYHDNPFSQIRIDRIPIDDARPFVGLTEEQEREFLDRCDGWQFPVFVTLLLTGLRPGELTHLLPEDLDLEAGWLWVRNKPDLGWQVKTRNERVIPLMPELVEVLRQMLGDRTGGTVFVRRRFWKGDEVPLQACARTELRAELKRRAEQIAATEDDCGERTRKQGAARTIWRDLGAVRTDRIREEFMRLTREIGLPALTAVKTTRHLFATCLQDANVDPLIRNELMGHAPGGSGSSGGSLGMTARYAHTRPETLRRQLTHALCRRPALAAARAWLARQRGGAAKRETA